MIRKDNTAEIYILSLDIFMLMAVLGITLGILFIVVNPSLKMSEPDSKKMKDSGMILFNDLDVFLNTNDIPEMQIDFNEYDYAQININSNNEIFRFVKKYTDGAITLNQIRKVNGYHNFVLITFTPNNNDGELDWGRMGEKREGDNAIYFENSEEESNFIDLELSYWEGLQTILLR